MLLTSTKDLGEIYEMLVKNPRSARDLLGLRISHYQRGAGTIKLYASINGLVEVQLENGGIVDLGPSGWVDGKITGVWMDQEQFDKICSYNRAKNWNKKSKAEGIGNNTPIKGYSPIDRLTTINQAADYLTELIGRIRMMAINDDLIQGLFNKFPGLESQLKNDVLISLIESPTWAVISKWIRADILFQYLFNSPKNEEAERYKRLKPQFYRNLPLAFWNKIPENFLMNETLWPFLPDEVQMRVLFQKIVLGKEVDEDIASFANLLWNYPSTDYLTKIPNEILFRPVLFTALSLDTKIHCLLGLLQESSDARHKTEVLTRMVELLKTPGIWPHFSQASDAVLLEPEIWALCPLEKKVPVLVKMIQAQPPDGNTRHQFIIELAENLSRDKDISRWFAIIPESVVMEPAIWLIWPAEKKVPILLKRIETIPLDDSFRRKLIIELADLMNQSQTYILWETIPHALRTEPEIYTILLPSLKVPIILETIKSLPASETRDLKIQELSGVLARAADPNLWRDIPEILLLEPALIEIAPFFIKLRLFKSAAKTILSDQIGISFDDNLLEDDDLCLVAGWVMPQLPAQQRTADKIRQRIKNLALHNEAKENDEWSRVLSARAAEIAVKRMYSRLNIKIEDTSILQWKNPGDPRWKNCDLISETDEIDVKNARASRLNPKTYVDYLVPRFKLNRTHPGVKDVLIAGVFSQNLEPKEILSSVKPSRLQCPKIQVLGVMSYVYLASLQSQINWCKEIDLDFTRKSMGQEKFLPPWVFNFPAEGYRMRGEAVEKINRIKTPIFELAKESLLNPLPFVLLLADPAAYALRIPAWQVSFIEAFCSIPREKRFSLPIIYLSVLNHFIAMTISSDKAIHGYEPVKMKEVIFVEPNKVNRPFFVFDPLATVATLIDTLQTLWENEHGFLRKFKSFRLIRLNVLRGKDNQDDQWKTLIAYCGTPNCHYSPLVLGKHDSCGEHKTCKRCGKIICPKCKVCDETCPENKARKEKASQLEISSLPEEPEFPPFDETMLEYERGFPEDSYWG